MTVQSPFNNKTDILFETKYESSYTHVLWEQLRETSSLILLALFLGKIIQKFVANSDDRR